MKRSRGYVFHLVLTAALVLNLGACAVAPTPIQVPYRPLLTEIDRNISSYDVLLDMNSRYPFAETEINNAQLGAGFFWLGMLGVVTRTGSSLAVEGAMAQGREEQAAAQGTRTVNLDGGNRYDLVNDARTVFAEAFQSRDKRFGKVLVGVRDESVVPDVSTADAVLTITIRQSFSPEFQRYNFKADMQLLSRRDAVSSRNRVLNGDDGASLYKNSLVYTATVDHIPAGTRDAYLKVWQADEGRLARAVMAQALRCLAELVRRDLSSVQEKPIQGLVPPEDLTLTLGVHALKGERVGSGAWMINSYTSDLLKTTSPTSGS